MRGHVARQIADLDAELLLRRASQAASARMLRDLTMLKKLVDDIEPAASADAHAPADADDASSLEELRVTIWKRYVDFARQRLGYDTSEEELAEAADAIFMERVVRGAKLSGGIATDEDSVPVHADRVPAGEALG